MKEVKETEVLELLKQGKEIKCKISSRDDFQRVRTETEFMNLVNLKEQGIQMAQFYCESSQLPENALEVSLDDAIKLVSKGETIYGITEEDEAEAEEFKTINSLVRFYRSAVVWGKPVLYWFGWFKKGT